MSILKSADESASACNRFTFSYSPVCGVGHFIHTYMGDGNPLPTFIGEPKRVCIENDIENYTNKIWNALDSNNKISLYVRYTNCTAVMIKRIAKIAAFEESINMNPVVQTAIPSILQQLLKI